MAKYNKATLHVANWLFHQIRTGEYEGPFDADSLAEDVTEAFFSVETPPDPELVVPALRMFSAAVDFDAVASLAAEFSDARTEIEHQARR